MTKCPACGADNSPGTEYCSRCARRLDEATASKVAETREAAVAQQSTGIRWVPLLFAGAMALAVVVIVVIIVVFLIH